MTKDDLSCHFKCYHDTIIDKKYFAFSYGDKQENRQSICLAKETLLGQYRLFDKISKEFVKIKIKISNNFQKKGQTSLDCLRHFDTRSGPRFTQLATQQNSATYPICVRDTVSTLYPQECDRLPKIRGAIESESFQSFVRLF